MPNSGKPYTPPHKANCRDSSRPSAHARGYGTGWARIRRTILREEPLCRVCGYPADEVDHIIPKANGGSERRENLQPLCKSCHSKKTRRENR